ncbi:MAG: sensor histidine kinase [Fluviicola sp.]
MALIENRYLLLVFLFVFGQGALGQERTWEPAYTNISVKDGLPSSETYYVHQDRKGFIWICTDRGVVRFDGYRYQVFTRENGLLDNVVFKVIEDHKGRIWFKSFNEQFCYFENDKIHPYKFNHLIAEFREIYLMPFSWINIDTDDNFYYSRKGKNEILKISEKGKTSILKCSLLPNYTKISGEWMFTSNTKGYKNGVIGLSFNGKRTGIDVHATSTNIAIGRQEINQFGGKVYVTNSNSIYSQNRDSCKLDFIIGSAKIGKDLWVGTLKGVYLFENIEKNGLKLKPKHFLKQYSVTHVCRDSEGGYWFSTLENGVMYVPDLTVLNSRLSENSAENNIYRVYRNKDYFIVSNIKGYYDFVTGKKLTVSGVTQNGIIPYIGNTPFIGKLSDKKINPIPGIHFFDIGFLDWCKESDTSIIMTGLGVVRFNRKGEQEVIFTKKDFRYFKKVRYIAKSIAILPNKEIIVADLKGVYKAYKHRFQPIEYSPKLRNTRVTDLEYHDYWGLVIATGGKGLFIVRNEKIVKIIDENNGLLSNHINYLFVDSKNYLYVCSNKGVSRIFYDGGKGYRVQNLTPFQGLKAQEVNSCFEYKNQMYFATKDGLSKTDNTYNWTNSLRRKQVRILDISANGKRIECKNNSISLDYQYKVIRIRLTSTNFKTKGKAPYKYRLSKTSSWSTGYEGEILLLNPAYDKFNIEIKYKNENGIWSQPYFLTSIEITPPFYQQIWFYIVVTICLLLLVVWILLRRIKTISRKAEIQRNMEILEQKALLAQMNPHFIFNALNSIQSFLLYDENELAERYLLKLSKLIRLTLSNSRETEITIQKEIDSLQMYLELEQMRFKNRFVFQINTSLTKEGLTKFIPPMLIQPFAENAIIHGFKGLEQGGEIQLNFLQIDGNRLIVEIMDNGIGYAKSKASANDSDHKSYATEITSERLNLFKERYQSEFDFFIETLDEKGNLRGTKVTISIPIFKRD